MACVQDNSGDYLSIQVVHRLVRFLKILERTPMSGPDISWRAHRQRVASAYVDGSLNCGCIERPTRSSGNHARAP
eukprot:1197138-Rhodomonas_salina.8